ncbi:MAG: hypothetical protein KatS3mg130_1273 [Candidatus Sumerlaea sp.]|nr:MAG: hypothetical protein KatS3mg130_1273 [Candidatus Sumerlaea sp.]
MARRGDQYVPLRNTLGARVAPVFGEIRHATFLVRDPELGGLPNERLVQAVWHEQLLLTENLRTCSGKSLKVLEPGRWNFERGPDFLDAELEIAGQRLRGDIEIHVKSSDWDRHRHGRDFEYNRVILHAFFRRDDALVVDTLHHGATIERLELEPMLLSDLETLSQSLEPEHLPAPPREHQGACHGVFAELDTGWLRKFFDEASAARMENKIARVVSQRQVESLDQVLYQSMMTAMGHKSSRTLFYILAKRVRLEELRDIVFDIPSADLPLALESVLMMVGGLLTLPKHAAECGGPAVDDETQAYLDSIYRWWSRLGGFYQDRCLEPTKRWYAGVRPASFPPRRIAGVAHILAQQSLRQSFVQLCRASLANWLANPPRTARDFRTLVAQLVSLFVPENPCYWRHRYTLGGRRMEHPMELIGKEQAYSIVFNALLPVLFCDARERKDELAEALLWRIHDNFPALQANAITRFMRGRLLGDTPRGTLNFRLEKTNQALLQLFQDCCRNNSRDCSSCLFRTQASEPRSVEEDSV